MGRTLIGFSAILRCLVLSYGCLRFVLTACRDHHADCKPWADRRECERNPGYMKVHCALSCGTCSMECNDKRDDCWDLTVRGACLLNASKMLEVCPSTCHVCGPGDLCRPASADRGAFPEPGDLATYLKRLPTRVNLRPFGPRVLGNGSWPIVFDNFMSEEEVDELLAVFQGGWTRSRMGNVAKDVSEREERTSDQIWCSHPACKATAAVQRLVGRVVNTTGIAHDNYEDVQVLRYLPGQRFRDHSDFILEQNRFACGPRVLTLFVYLSDSPDAGTHFPLLNLTVQARRGSAALWPSTTSDNIFDYEPLSVHEGLPPSSTTKFAANIWIHQYRFQQYFELGCILFDRPGVFYPAKATNLEL
eukprot:TRINITY_DN40073_c0_g1_i1.p1 TRINITY_DN40073_c0_g1~~TRINITY_DN40073_c0_g1_i1.p1  ORF type:complete len:361 (-),score=31.46 TRINITY_DN40073_c0_g1_i1:295-1377(-)